MSDIVERLREFGTEQSLYPLCTEAADEIERLEAALRPFAEMKAMSASDLVEFLHKHCGEARAALGGKMTTEEMLKVESIVAEMQAELDRLGSHVSHLEAHRDDLMAEIEQLKAALRICVDELGGIQRMPMMSGLPSPALEAARAALEGKK